jgi:hypothetical protein
MDQKPYYKLTLHQRIYFSLSDLGKVLEDKLNLITDKIEEIRYPSILTLRKINDSSFGANISILRKDLGCTGIGTLEDALSPKSVYNTVEVITKPQEVWTWRFLEPLSGPPVEHTSVILDLPSLHLNGRYRNKEFDVIIEYASQSSYQYKDHATESCSNIINRLANVLNKKKG